MLELIIKIGTDVLWISIQILVGCMLSVPIYRLNQKKLEILENNIVKVLLLMVSFSLLGMLLPMHTYGLLPLVIALISVGFRIYMILPLIMSNVIFNMLVPYTDPSFVWRTGFKRIIFAFTAALTLGIIFKLLHLQEKRWFKAHTLTCSTLNKSYLKCFIEIFQTYMNTVGIYLLLGITINTLFHKYYLWNLLDFIFKNPNTSFIPRFFAGYNVVNPFFLLSTTVIMTLMDFTRLSALLTMLNLRGIALYYIYFISLAILLGTSAFIL